MCLKWFWRSFLFATCNTCISRRFAFCIPIRNSQQCMIVAYSTARASVIAFWVFYNCKIQFTQLTQTLHRFVQWRKGLQRVQADDHRHPDWSKQRPSMMRSIGDDRLGRRLGFIHTKWSFFRRTINWKLRYDNGITCCAFLRNAPTRKDQTHADFVTTMEIQNLNFKTWIELLQRQTVALLDSM